MACALHSNGTPRGVVGSVRLSMSPEQGLGWGRFVPSVRLTHSCARSVKAHSHLSYTVMLACEAHSHLSY